MSVLFSSGKRDEADADLTIGVVNNMPDSALEATERQFASLIGTAAGSNTVRLRYFALGQVPRGEAARQRMQRLYSDIGALWSAPLDGLIVTGAEPCAADLKDEPYWASLIEVLGWARANAVSSIWSCLAAHAVVLHLSGIKRRRLPEKCSGVFSFEKARNHLLTDGLPAQFLMPHSRYNGLREDELADAGFTILSRSSDVGVDMFLKDGESPLLFVQGHPEYDALTLLREYRRDIRRFLRRETESYPAMPLGYFDEGTTAHFTRVREHALKQRSEAGLRALWTGRAEPPVSNVWRPTAARLYTNWLSLLMRRKGTPAAKGLALELGHVHRDSRQAFRQ